MKRTHGIAVFLMAGGLLISLSGAAFAQGDAMFAREAAMGGMTEVELGKLAVQKGQNDKVKEFGQRMVDDHSKAGDRLRELAGKENLTLPFQLDAEHQAIVDRFAKMSGTEFDRAYARDMVQDHQTDVALFEKEANGGSHPTLKNFASETLPTLREHLRMAKENEHALGVTSSK
jgi:putative membrane protein